MQESIQELVSSDLIDSVTARVTLQCVVSLLGSMARKVWGLRREGSGKSTENLLKPYLQSRISC